MIITEHENDVETSKNFNQTAFTIQASKKAFNILSSNVYTNKIAAVIRELSTNAYDAHTEAGNEEPFYVHLPTSLEPWLEVRDYGNGMSYQDCMSLYTTYFYSTKTNSNNLTGCLGIGSKSPYSISDNFVVTSVHNGIKYTYSAYKDKNGYPQFAELSHETTQEPSGMSVVVQTGINSISTFRTEAVNIYKYFDKLPRFNIDISHQLKEKYDIVTDWYSINIYRGELKAVMGNIAYKIKDFDVSGYIKFNIGELNFDAGRERLSNDSFTTESVNKKLGEFRADLNRIVLEKINSRPTHMLKCIDAHKYKYGCNNFLDYDINKYSLGKSKDIKYFHKPSLKKQPIKSFTDTIDPSTIKNNIFLYEDRYETIVKHNVKNNFKTIYLLTEEQIKDCSIDRDYVRSLSELEKPHRNYSSRARTKAYNSFFMVDGDFHPCELDTSKEYVYVSIFKKDTLKFSKWVLSRCENIFKEIGLNIVYINGNIRKIGKGIPLEDYLKERYSHVKNVLMPENKKVFSVIDKRFRVKYDSDFIHLLQRSGIKVEDDYSLIELSKEYLKKFPMLKFVEDVEDKDLKIIKEYVGAK